MFTIKDMRASAKEQALEASCCADANEYWIEGCDWFDDASM